MRMANYSVILNYDILSNGWIIIYAIWAFDSVSRLLFHFFFIPGCPYSAVFLWFVAVAMGVALEDSAFDLAEQRRALSGKQYTTETWVYFKAQKYAVEFNYEEYDKQL